jgi:hypothetical protein
MLCVTFEPTIPASEGAKTIHALDRSVTVTGTGTALPLPYWYYVHTGLRLNS